MVGKNGCGKTTLMRKIWKKQIQSFPIHISTAYCEQEMEETEETVLETLLNSDKEIEMLKKNEIKVQNDLEKGTITTETAQKLLSDINNSLEMKQIHLLETNAINLLRGFGFTKKMHSIPSNELSGGFKQKLALAKTLFLNPDVLCLDVKRKKFYLKLFIFIFLYYFLFFIFIYPYLFFILLFILFFF